MSLPTHSPKQWSLCALPLTLVPGTCTPRPGEMGQGVSGSSQLREAVHTHHILHLQQIRCLHSLILHFNAAEIRTDLLGSRASWLKGTVLPVLTARYLVVSYRGSELGVVTPISQLRKQIQTGCRPKPHSSHLPRGQRGPVATTAARLNFGAQGK